MKLRTVTLITLCAFIAWGSAFAIERIPIGSGGEGVAIDTRTQTAVITSKSYTGLGAKPVDTGTISIIDLKTKQVTKVIKGGGVPVGPAINERTNTLVFSDKAHNEVVLMDLTTGTERARIPVGVNPSCVGIDPQHNIATVASVDDSKVYVIDLASAKITHTIPVNAAPVCMHYCINPNDMTAIVSHFGGDALTVMDIKNGRVLKTIPVGGALSSGASLNLQTNTAVVPLGDDNAVAIIDLNSGTVTRTVPVGAFPVCSVIHEKTNTAFISNYVGGSVSAIDLSTGTLIRTLEGVGEGATCLAIDEAHNLLVVSTHSGDVALLRLDELIGGAPTAVEAQGKQFTFWGLIKRAFQSSGNPPAAPAKSPAEHSSPCCAP